jgi:hypothetical protein
MQSPRKSLKHFPQQLSFVASSTYWTLQGVKLFPYKIEMQQACHGSDEARRGDFKVFLEDNPAVPQSMLFSDEANFHLNGSVNKPSMCALASEHLHNMMET